MRMADSATQKLHYLPDFKFSVEKLKSFHYVLSAFEKYFPFLCKY